MAHSPSARKRVRQNVTARANNRWRLRTMRDSIKDFREAIIHGTVESATDAFKKASKIIDRTSAKGTIHKNQGARRKSRMSAALKAKKTAKPAKA